jgi:hypothetical protein
MTRKQPGSTGDLFAGGKLRHRRVGVNTRPAEAAEPPG